MAKYEESKETPKMEAQEHSKGFLHKAAALKRKKGPKKRA